MTSPYGRRSGTRLTPKEIRTWHFARASLRGRGYAVDEVDAFLAKVADEVAEAERERAGLRAEIDRLRDYFRNQGVEIDRSKRADERRRRVYDGLVEHVRDYTWIQVELAQQFASLLHTAAAEADSLLYHARLRSALAVEQALLASSGGETGRGADPEELRRVKVWLRAFGYAVQVQVDGATDALRAV